MMSVFGLHFAIEGFGWAVLGAIIISVVSLPLNLFTGNTKTSIKVQGQRRPPNNSNSGGDGPVIDV